MTPDVHHAFPGDGPLGGERHNRDDVAAWFDRLFRLLPGLEFHVHALAVDGTPGNTVVGVEWTNTSTLLDRSSYANRGAHILRLSKGKVTPFTPTCTTPPPSPTQPRLSAHGLSEAAAQPITTSDKPWEPLPRVELHHANLRRYVPAAYLVGQRSRLNEGADGVRFPQWRRSCCALGSSVALRST